MTDRATLMTVTQQSDELIENLVSKVPELPKNRPDIRKSQKKVCNQTNT
jgi:hypothetical protein